MAHPPTQPPQDLPPVEPDDVPGSDFAPGVDEPAAEVADADEAAEAEDLLGRCGRGGQELAGVHDHDGTRGTSYRLRRRSAVTSVMPRFCA